MTLKQNVNYHDIKQNVNYHDVKQNVNYHDVKKEDEEHHLQIIHIMIQFVNMHCRHKGINHGNISGSHGF